MNISRTSHTGISQRPNPSRPQPESASTSTIEGYEQSLVEQYLPAAMGILGAAAGVAGGFANGSLGQAGRIIAFAGMGAGLGTLNALGSDTSGITAHYGASTLIGAALGAGVGAFAISGGGPLVAISGAVLGGAGSAMAGITASSYLSK